MYIYIHEEPDPNQIALKMAWFLFFAGWVERCCITIMNVTAANGNLIYLVGRTIQYAKILDVAATFLCACIRLTKHGCYAYDLSGYRNQPVAIRFSSKWHGAKGHATFQWHYIKVAITRQWRHICSGSKDILGTLSDMTDTCIRSHSDTRTV